MTTLKEVKEAFFYLHDVCYEKDFTKTLQFRSLGEKEFLIPLRFYLLGWFGHVLPERSAKNSEHIELKGRYDFIVGDIAIEVALRKLDQPKSCLMPQRNFSEIDKLIRHDSMSVLVLLDFSTNDPLTEQELAEYRTYNPIAKTGFKGTYNIHYLYRDGGETKELRRRISF